MPPLSQMNCHSCHQPIRAGSKFCPLCGAAQAPVTPCPACHAPVVAGKTACPQCGASLDVAVGEPAPNDDDGIADDPLVHAAVEAILAAERR